MLTVMLLLCFEQKPTKLPVPVRPAQLKELNNDGSFVANFQFEKLGSNDALPEHSANFFQIKAQRELFKNLHAKTIPSPILKRHGPSKARDYESGFVSRREMPYYPWFVSLLQHELWPCQLICERRMMTGWSSYHLTDGTVSYVISKEPDEWSLDYVGSLAWFSFIRARGKTEKEVERKLLEKYKEWLDDLAETVGERKASEDDLPGSCPLIAKPADDCPFRNRDLPARLFPAEIP